MTATPHPWRTDIITTAPKPTAHQHDSFTERAVHGEPLEDLTS